MNSLPEWKLPTGTSREVWNYVIDAEQALSYDQTLPRNPLLRYDLQFATRWFTSLGQLLDLGCGTGRLMVSFARRGFSAVGVDLSFEMFSVALQKARQAGANVEMVRANLVELDCLRDTTFECAACLFSTLGMIHGHAERRQALAHFYRVLKPGGRLVLHVYNRGFHVWTRAGRHWLIRDFFRHCLGHANRGDFTQPDLGGFALHHFTRREIVHELRRAGFRILEVEPVSLRDDSRLRWPWWCSRWRAYGYLIAAERLST